jgi:prephenate dehydrogenase
MQKKSVKFNKVAIVGTGLIGGSLGLALKKKRIAKRIVGFARHNRTLSLAKKIGAIDIGSRDLKTAQDADLIVLATPVSAIISTAKQLSRIVKKDVIVTDVGSTKKEIVFKLEKIFTNYIGSHPLAGSQKSGVEHSCRDIFKDTICLLTPTAKTKKQTLRIITRLWKELGTRVVLISPREHDKIIAFVSHLPHLLAFALMDLIPRNYLRFAASGLKDTTRIAASGAHLWQDIFITNRDEILYSLRRFNRLLKNFEKLLLKKDLNRLRNLMVRAKEKRDSLR